MSAPALLAIAMIILMPAPAFALTVTNRDSTEHTVTFDKGEQETKQKIAPGASAKEDCPNSCAVRIEGFGHDFMAKTGDSLMIKDNKVRPDKK